MYFGHFSDKHLLFRVSSSMSMTSPSTPPTYPLHCSYENQSPDAAHRLMYRKLQGCHPPGSNWFINDLLRGVGYMLIVALTTDEYVECLREQVQ